MRRALCVLTGWLAAAGAAAADGPRPPAPQPQAPTAGNAETGRARFKEYVCYYCHGTEGQGSSPQIGPRIAGTPRSLDSFIRYVRRPAGQMSSFSEAVVSDAVLTDIHAYLKSLPAAPKAADVPLLQRLKR